MIAARLVRLQDDGPEPLTPAQIVHAVHAVILRSDAAMSDAAVDRLDVLLGKVPDTSTGPDEDGQAAVVAASCAPRYALTATRRTCVPNDNRPSQELRPVRGRLVSGSPDGVLFQDIGDRCRKT